MNSLMHSAGGTVVPPAVGVRNARFAILKSKLPDTPASSRGIFLPPDQGRVGGGLRIRADPGPADQGSCPADSSPADQGSPADSSQPSATHDLAQSRFQPSANIPHIPRR